MVIQFDSSGMRHFLSVAVPDYEPLHRKTVAVRFNIQLNAYSKRLNLILNNVESISLTTDLWKSRQNSYFLCLTAYFFDDHFCYHPLIISF